MVSELVSPIPLARAAGRAAPGGGGISPLIDLILPWEDSMGVGCVHRGGRRYERVVVVV